MTSSEIGQSMLDVVCMLRKEMSSIQNKFSGNFLSDCQLKAVPTQLITLISMLIDGCGIENKEFSQESITISQLIQTNFHKYSKKDLTTNHRIQKYSETPVALYTTLKIYATVRSRNLINTYFNMGLCLSYTRILEITCELSNASISQYNCNKVFAPSVLRKGLFTIIAKDNIDHNASSSTAVKHYHGTSMTVMQSLTDESAGEQQTFLSNIDFSNQQSKTSDLKMPSSYIQVLPHYFKKEKLYGPLCTIDMSMYGDNTIYLEGILEETAWLEKVSSSSVFDSWSKHHSQMNHFSVLVPGVIAILPLIPEPVHTLNMQYHCMKIIMQTVNFLNPGQIPVDVSDQPVYASTKELQWRELLFCYVWWLAPQTHVTAYSW